MPFVTILIALDLVVVGVVGYLATGKESPTALIPSGIGGVLLVLGFLGLKKNLRKHAMHGVAAFSILGFVGTLGGLMELPKIMGGMDQVARPAATISKIITGLLCLHLFLFCLISFIEARLARMEKTT